MSNFKDDKLKYHIPTPLFANWNYIGDGKFTDPTIGSSEMNGRRWTINSEYSSGKSFDKFQQSLKKI